jgi:site-specific recombinase XerD
MPTRRSENATCLDGPRKANTAAVDTPDALSLHLRHLQVRNLQPTTIRARRYQMLRVARFLKIDRRALLDADRTDLEDWQQSMTHLSPRYRLAATTHVRGFYKWAAVAELINRDPSVTLARVKIPQSMPRPIGEDDLEVAINCAPDRLRLMLVLAAYAGMRVLEIANLTRGQVLDQADPPVLLVRGKGDRERVVPMSPRVLAEFRVHGLPARGLIFPRMDGQSGANSPQRISHLLNDYLHSLGINDTAHSLRHRFGTQCYRVSVDLRMTQAVMGHSSPATTSGYVAWSSAAAVLAVQALPGASMLGEAEPVLA